MNEEIARILQMLEDGKIDADAAEKLIRALRERAQPGAGEGERRRNRPAACRDLADVLRDLGRSVRRSVLAQRRLQWWRYYQYARAHEAERARRAATLGTAERVKFVLTDRVMADAGDLENGSRLADDLHIDRTGFEVLSWALRDELGVEPHVSTLRELGTVEALVAWVASRKGEGSQAPQTPTDPTPAPDEAGPAGPPAD